jgi:hypothetical protein
MSVISKLATTLAIKDDAPNQQLAEEITAKAETGAVKELVSLLSHKDKGIQSDCIKTLYEIGIRKPGLIAPYIKVFLDLLQGKNNRLQWGAMHALAAITSEKPVEVYNALPQIAAAAEQGSVITRDHYVAILLKLMAYPMYTNDSFHLFNEVLQNSPTNQLPMYAENALPVVPKQHREKFSLTLQSRLEQFDKESKRKRVEKVIKKLGT